MLEYKEGVDLNVFNRQSIFKPKGSIVLSDYTLSLPLKAEAYYCPTCKMVIMYEKGKQTSEDFSETLDW